MEKLNIKEFLDQDEKKDLLRLLTAGSVDDGKSTLIGRLLFDSKKLYEDKLDGLRQQYATANQQGKEKLAPAILDLEKRILQMNVELDALGVSVRNAEKTKSK